jgi:hypothetical protein
MEPGMKNLASLSAVVVLSAAAAPFGGASAATVNITGYSYEISYGTSIAKNNVVNFAPSGIKDNTTRRQRPWKAGGQVNSTLQNYAVDWYFNGAESGYTNTFTSGSLSFSEHNENNRLEPGNDGGWKSLGTTYGSGLGDPIVFSVLDQNGKGVTNGENNKWPAGYSPSLIFSYASPLYDGNKIAGWELSLTATDWFVFAFNDNGSKDKDHDDYIGLAHVYELAPVPIPGALPLMGSVMGGSYLFRRWRSSRRKKAGSAASA